MKNSAHSVFHTSVVPIGLTYCIRCIMSLTRGVTSKLPCPICIVKFDVLSDLTRTWPLRTAIHNQNVFQEVQSMKRAIDREKLLSENGIRDVDVSPIPKLQVHADWILWGRMYSGVCITLMCIVRSHLTGSIQITVACLVTTSGRCSKNWFPDMVAKKWPKLMCSNFRSSASGVFIAYNWYS